MFTPVINSPQTSLFNESLDPDLNEHINSLQTSLVNQLESLPKTHSTLQQIFHLIPIIFRFLHQNFQSQQTLFTEYNALSKTIQNVISISAQYLHDRHDHENELLLLKDKISRILGQIGSTQQHLEQYWIIIHSLEHEIDRFQILLSNPQVLQINQRQFQILQESQKIKLDRLIKENEKMKLLINKQIESIQTIQLQIESDVKELQRLKPILHDAQLEQKDVHTHWSQIEKQTSYLQTLIEKSKNMENEYNDRLKTTKTQYDLVQKQLNTITNTHDQTNQKLLSLQTNETKIKQEIENIKNEISTEQTRSLLCRDQIHNLQYQTHHLELAKRDTHHTLKSEEHTNFTLVRKKLMLENNRLKLHNRVENLTTQLTNITQRNQTYERTISLNILHLENQQNKITSLNLTLKKMIHLNNNFEKLLQENRFNRINEQEKLHSIKQISFQKRKQLITHTKRLRILSINEHHLIHKTIRNFSEIIQFNNIVQDTNNTEKYFQSIFRKKKREIIKREKYRASLSHYLHDNENRIHFLTKKTQLIENELRNKIDHFRLLQSKIFTQKHDQIRLSNEKQYCIYSYREKLQKLEKIHKQSDQLEKRSEQEIDYIIKKNEENEELKLNIQNIKQQIINMMSRNQRQIDQCSLLNEKIRLYTQLNDMNQQQQQRCAGQMNRFSGRILNLQQENNRLSKNLHNSQKKTMKIISTHHDKLVRKDNLYQINQTLSHRSFTIRDSPIRVHTHKALEDYSIFVNRLMKIIHQCVQWREKLAWINQLYFRKIEQIHQQTKLISTENEMILRYQIDSEIKQCKAMKAELRLQIY